MESWTSAENWPSTPWFDISPSQTSPTCRRHILLLQAIWPPHMDHRVGAMGVPCTPWLELSNGEVLIAPLPIEGSLVMRSFHISVACMKRFSPTPDLLKPWTKAILPPVKMGGHASWMISLSREHRVTNHKPRMHFKIWSGHIINRNLLKPTALPCYLTKPWTFVSAPTNLSSDSF